MSVDKLRHMTNGIQQCDNRYSVMKNRLNTLKSLDNIK